MPNQTSFSSVVEFAAALLDRGTPPAPQEMQQLRDALKGMTDPKARAEALEGIQGVMALLGGAPQAAPVTDALQKLVAEVGGGAEGGGPPATPPVDPEVEAQRADLLARRGHEFDKFTGMPAMTFRPSSLRATRRPIGGPPVARKPVRKKKSLKRN